MGAETSQLSLFSSPLPLFGVLLCSLYSFSPLPSPRQSSPPPVPQWVVRGLIGGGGGRTEIGQPPGRSWGRDDTAHTHSAEVGWDGGAGRGMDGAEGGGE